MLKENKSLVSKDSRKLVAKRPALVFRHSSTQHKRYFLSLARNTSRPGVFEMLGSYDLNTDDAELFGDDRYRRLMNLLIFRSQM